MKKNTAEKKLLNALESQLGISISKIELNDNYISHVSFNSPKIGDAVIKRLTTEGAFLLFEFYYNGLSLQSRQLFYPYPLFNPPLSSPQDLSERIKKWESEKDWTVMILYKNNTMLGISVLKRLGTENATSGLAVRDDYQGMGLGYILQTLVVEQARLLSVKSFHAKIEPDNIPSIKLHEKCGFVNAGKVHYTHFRDGKEVTDTVIRMEITL